MLALAQSEASAKRVLIEDIAAASLQIVEIDKLRRVTVTDDLYETDEHLATNAENIEAGKRTVWGTIHIYKGEGEA